MTAENLTDVINKLTPAEQNAVREFIEFLKQQRPPFLKAVDEFIRQHPDLLAHLAK
jgi:hypothetical protein